MKRIFALVLTLFILIGALPVFADSAEEGRVKKMVVLGDSISTGYGLEGYSATEQNPDIPSYANLAAKELGLTLGKDYFNLAVDGETSAELLAGLEGAYSEEKLESIKDADVIAVSIGGNDVIEMLFPKIAKLLGLEEDASPLAVVLALASIKQSDLEDTLKNSKNIYDESKDDFEAQYEIYAENIGKIIEKLKELSPDANIFFQTVYNPMIDASRYTLVETLDVNLVSKVITRMNDSLSDAVKENKCHIVDIAAEFEGRREPCTRADDFDVHPTELGHSIIADALVLEINEVYDAMENGNGDDAFKKPKYTWIFFAATAAVVVACVPISVFVAKKCKK